MNFEKLIGTITVIIRNLFLGTNVISLSLLTKPRQMIDYVTENMVLFKTLNNNWGIPQKNVFEVLGGGGDTAINLANLKFGETWFLSKSSYVADIISLCLICKIINPKIVFEIGTLNGYTALHFALNTANDAKIFTLDLPKNFESSMELKTTIVDDYHVKASLGSRYYCFEDNDIANKKITCLFGDSATFDFSPYYGKVDFFFIDGAHSYEYVKSDTMNALECVKKGSVIAWHDFGRAGVNGVSKWVSELAKSHQIFVIPGGSLAYMVVD